MSIHSWLQNLRSRLAPRRGTGEVSGTRRPHSRRGALRATKHRLFLEPLEDRRLLAFSAPVAYAVPESPQAVVSAYFNDDPIADLAIVNYADSSVSVLLGNGDGSFQGAINYPSGANPLSLAVGDLDGDGDLDLATANANDVSVLRGYGDGTFAAPTSYGVGSNLSSVAVGDFTGDGKLDLGVISNNSYYYYGYYYGYQGQANVLMGDGAGNFSAPNSTWLGYGYFTAATAANLDGDGADEFLAANSHYGDYYGAVVIVVGDANGNLQVSNYVFTGQVALGIVAGDIDEDGDTDIVTANGYSGVSVLLGDGVGGFGAAQTYAGGSYLSSVVLGDFTGDGNVDIIAADYHSASVRLHYGDGNGNFSAAVPFTTGAYPWSVAAGDFNSDLWLDIVTTDGVANSVSVSLNDQNWPPAPAALSINDVTVTEGDTGTITAVFTVTRSGNLDNDSSVSYSTSNGGALAGSDYVAVSNGTVMFAPGVAAMTIAIQVKGDLTDEYDQGFYVNLAAASGAVIVDGVGFANIIDNDAAPTITITAVVSAKEGNQNQTTAFSFIVTLSAPSEKNVQVSYATANGTATTADGDYVGRSGTLTFAPGVTSQVISVQVKGDKKKESIETFFVNLSSATNATIAGAQGRGEIVDDDTPGAKGKS